MIKKQIALLVIIFFIGCDSTYSLPTKFNIIHSSNVWGETEPCG